MNGSIADIYHSLQEITWLFSSHGVNGLCCADLSFVEFIAFMKIMNAQFKPSAGI